MGPGEPSARASSKSKIVAGLLFVALALAQAWFAYVFTAMVTVVSQTEWYTINSRWVYPWIALASCVVFARNAWRCFKPGQAAGQ